MATREQVQDLLDKMTEQRRALVEAARLLDDASATRVPVGKTGEGEWTAKEQLAHLCEMELGYTTWVRAALTRENPDLSGLEAPAAAIPIEDANRRSVSELLDVMAAERRDTLALIHGLSLDDFDRTATQPMFGTLTVLQWLRSFYRHDRMHMDQIAGREPDYRPRFTGVEPDQRAARLARVRKD